MTNVPASHGQWGGYRTTKAVAWVIQAEGKWLAHCKDQTTNPMPLNEAKAAAMAIYLDVQVTGRRIRPRRRKVPRWSR
jgi:hypothetical protein